MKNLGKSIVLVFALIIFFPIGSLAQGDNGIKTLSLNGKWEMGFARRYTQTVTVPGIATDPTHIGEDTLWYKKEIRLPEGNWTSATLELKGARFRPQVYINGKLDGQQEGGMGPVFLILKNGGMRPGNRITMEIALASLSNVPQTDASYIPQSDQWRSDVSSGLWDDVILHLHGDVSINRIVPFTNYRAQTVHVQFDLNGADGFKGKANLQIADANGRMLISKTAPVSGNHNAVDFAINAKLKSWSPQNPNLYHLKLTIVNSKGGINDQSVIPFGVKSFEVKNKQFYLNDKRFIAKGITVVWHRWVRTGEGRGLGYDTAWFKRNIIMLSKNHGANYLRFHLGLPVERFLDMCDKYGLVVQFEWSFFHGMPASKESLLIQYKNWLDLAMRHPSVVLIHPYNETAGEQLKTAWTVLDELLKQYPPLVLEDRDVIHIHKYWWSMFENLGLYYDNSGVFPKAIMADEFGGNYLNEKGDLGEYPAIKESFLRFLGRENTREERLQFQAESNARIAEYWRRIDAAGFSPFCALASNEDGNNWFMGLLKDARPKPVWDALTAAFSPRSVSIDIWDKDFISGQNISLPVYLFNDEDTKAVLAIKLTVENKAGKIFFTKAFTAEMDALSKKVQRVPVNLPVTTGDYTVKAELMNRPQTVKYPVISQWSIRVLKAEVPENLKNVNVGIFSDEPELKQFFTERHIKIVDAGDADASVILTSEQTWNKLAEGDKNISDLLQAAVANGRSVVMLDVGDRQLGQGYPKKAGELGPLQGVAKVSDPRINSYNLFGGILLKFTETAEPESFIHPDKANRELWGNMPNAYTGIWNGLRGGLIVPAADMQFSGLSAGAFVAQWKARGANEVKITSGPYYAYELQGFYIFSDQPDDPDLKKKLKEKVNFLVQDAPSLAASINLNMPVTVTDLTKGYHDAEKGIADNFTGLANCAKNLTQTPVALVGFGKGKGKLIVSQLLTSGRLAKGFEGKGLYGIRYDEAAVQYILNMISLSLKR
ncbi:glycoside hydrolase family 2 TIM barrel-domain containing protein [Mucilaginibacter ginsenosidivorax]|uniref:Glycoside hydrolase n=1 Tax=Mucilaginibacter ginsenosidivorax TaxID=862126 RepID=A0A5B8W6M9_9SPHI|nr:glycoside hydrolase family 2 TIM barrel-domain containing protein [Mucilaginibacter ginsenosidivorax]QEC78585.1 glycoside hydrolase [Mucilaginibacter ginsenosidivorax]